MFKVPGIPFVVGILIFMDATRAFAGPPYLTDDPEPTDYGHFENYVFGLGDHRARSYAIQGPAVEINYGGLPDTQFSLTVPLLSVGGNTPSAGGSPTGAMGSGGGNAGSTGSTRVPMASAGGNTPSATGLGDILLGVKYRFIHETNGWPQVAFYPAITLPTGQASRNLGNGRPAYQLPVWAQKSRGPWTTYGGGGAWINPAPGARDYGFAGWLLQRDFGEHLTLGGEIYAQGRDADDDRGFVAPNFGGTYKFNEHFSLLGSAGHSVVGQTHTLWYFALGINW